MFFRQRGKLLVNSDDMTTDQKHWIIKKSLDLNVLFSMCSMYLWCYLAVRTILFCYHATVQVFSNDCVEPSNIDIAHKAYSVIAEYWYW